MVKQIQVGSFLLTLALILSACASAPQTTGQAHAPDEARPGATKRIVAGIRGTTPVLYRKLQVGASYSGLTYLEPMVNAGMATIDTQGALHPQLAEAVPSLENGLW